MTVATTLRKNYDTPEGIADMIRTLAGFNQLSRLRDEAGYLRGERLNQFYILGRWFLDTCGNTMKIVDEFIPKEKFPQIPDVLTAEEFWLFIRQHGGNVSITSTPEAIIPPVRITCAECGKPWTIRNAHDFIPRRESPVFSLANFVGMTLGEVRSFLDTRTDAVWRLRTRDKPIRHDRFIDLTPHPDYPTMKMNEYGWAGKDEGITDEYIIQAGDEAAPAVWYCYHSACNRVALERFQRERFTRVFENAGFGTVSMTAIPNRYWQHDYATPWFEVSTQYGVIVIGWRKRVINLDWSATGIVAPVPGEDVTCGEGWTHAWGEDKATEYLTRIRLAAEETVVR